MAEIKLRVVRALWLHGCELRAGEIIKAGEADALAMIDSGRAELHDPADASMLRAFALAAVQKTLARLNSGIAPAPGRPWQAWRT